MYEQIRIVWLRGLVLPKSDGDKDFLERMDKAWAFLFAVATVAFFSIVAQLLVDVKMHVLAVFVGALVLPACVQVWGIISDSAKLRFYSWAMIVICIITFGMWYLYGLIWFPRIMPLLVPSFMDPFDFIMIFSTVDLIIVLVSMKFAIGRVVRHFRTNLKSKSRRIQIPEYRGLAPLNFFLLATAYMIGTEQALYSLWGPLIERL
jgi:hypothetical protein